MVLSIFIIYTIDVNTMEKMRDCPDILILVNNNSHIFR